MGEAWTPDRRGFLRLLSIGWAAVFAAFSSGVLRFLSPDREAQREAPLELADPALELWEQKQLIYAGRPVSLLRSPDGYVAYSAVCTHMGCVLKWRPGRRQFFCPCHGGRFGATGEVLGGPPRRPLEKLLVVADAGRLRIERG